MRKSLFFMLAAIVLLALPALANAQNRMAIGGGLEISLPMGDFGDGVNTGFGVTAGGVYNYKPQIDLIAQAGYISWGTKFEGASFSAIPIQVGGRYFFMAEPGGPYGGALLGFHIFSNSESKTKFSFAPLVGYEMKIGEKLYFDGSVRYQVVSDANYLGVRVGINYDIK